MQVFFLKRFFFIFIFIGTNILFCNISMSITSVNGVAILSPEISPPGELPDNFIPSNDLRTPKNYRYCMQKSASIKISGFIYDDDYIPITNAKIQIWHLDDKGCDKNDPNKDNLMTSCNKCFAGNGTAFTNNIGYYEFYTIKPMHSSETVPKVNLRVMHPDFVDFYTILYFSDYKNNHNDSHYMKIDEEYKMNVLAMPSDKQLGYYNYKFDIFLNGSSRYKNY